MVSRRDIPSRMLARAAAAVLAAVSVGGMTGAARSQTARVPVVKQEPGLNPAASLLLMQFRAEASTRRAAWEKSHGPVMALPGAVVGPQLTSGTVTSTSLVVGNAFAHPSIEFNFVDNAAPLSSGFFIFTSPSGYQEVLPQFSIGTLPRRGTFSFEAGAPLDLFAEPGTWTMTGAYLFDAGGNETQYTQAQLAAIFTQNTFQVINNGTPDGTPPTVTAGKILTPKVKLSEPYPEIKGYIDASDSISGAYLALVYFVPPGTGFGVAGYYPLPFSIQSGKVAFYLALNGTYPVGRYPINEYQVCDLAGNCFTDTSPSDIKALFGKPFVDVVQ